MHQPLAVYSYNSDTKTQKFLTIAHERSVETNTIVQVYNPVQKVCKAIADQYMVNGRYSQMKSEERKKQIWASIRDIRKELRELAMSTVRKNNQIIRPLPYKAQQAIKDLQICDRLIDRIFSEKQVTCSNN